MKFLKTLAPLAAAAALLAAPLTSRASLELTLDDGLGHTVTVLDGPDSDGLNGQVGFNGVLGLWTVNVSTGLGGSSSPFSIDLNSINKSGPGSSGSLSIYLSQNNISGYSGPVAFSGAIGGTTRTSIAYDFWQSNTNVLYAQTNHIFGGLTSNSPFSDSGSNSFSVTDPFSLTLGVQIAAGSNTTTSFDFEGSIPEPSSIALVGLAMLGLGVAARRRQA